MIVVIGRPAAVVFGAITGLAALESVAVPAVLEGGDAARERTRRSSLA